MWSASLAYGAVHPAGAILRNVARRLLKEAARGDDVSGLATLAHDVELSVYGFGGRRAPRRWFRYALQRELQQLAHPKPGVELPACHEVVGR